ncbi:MAG: DUF6502 family protein [Proteobacteria bacterium]|nr:DUF6502 family protein [Pseudomonadota bacterium]
MKNTEQTSSRIKSAIATTAVKIFSPLVRILLRNGITYKTASQWLRWTYTEVARKEFKLSGRMQSKSRVAILTGLSRIEVDRLMKAPHPHKTTAIDQYHRASRVLDGWMHDPIYRDKNDEPLNLSFDGPTPSFSSLVESYSGGVPPRSIEDELLRVKSIEVSEDGKITLKSTYFVAINDKDTLYQFGMLGFATNTLIDTIDYNMYKCPDPSKTHLQLIASNDNIPVDILDDIKKKLQEYGRKCVVDADSYMFEKTSEQLTSERVKRAGISVYYFEDNESRENS